MAGILNWGTRMSGMWNKVAHKAQKTVMSVCFPLQRYLLGMSSLIHLHQMILHAVVGQHGLMHWNTIQARWQEKKRSC